MTLAITIEDVLVSASNNVCIAQVINMLREKYEVKDLGTPTN